VSTSTYGHFSPEGDAFHITSPDAPRPWANIISNGRYGLAISHNGGGFSWLDHCQLNVITRWDMDLTRDDRGRCLYLTDLDSDSTPAPPVWSLAPQPCRPEYDRYECTHRPGSTLFETSIHGIETAWTVAVASSDTAELWHLTIKNTSDSTRRLRLGSFFEWCCGVAPDVKREFHRLFFTTEYASDSCAIVATKNMWEAPFGNTDDHWNRPWPHTAAFSIGGLDAQPTLCTSDKEAFLGRYGNPARPAAMTRQAPADTPQKFGRFVDASAALGADLTLAPGESRSISFVIAVGDDRAQALALCDKYADPASVQAEIRVAENAWTERLAATSVQTDAVDVNNLNSTWLPYQAISGRLWGRTGYYQQSGAYGFRDQLQDSQVWLPLEPARCAEQIMLHAAHQFADGSVYHWWNPITETGNHTACSDDYLWLPFIAAAYIRETGDLTILDRTAPFVDDEKPVSLREHCERAIAKSFARFGSHGLPLIGDMDWNDGLSAIGHPDSGESVWLAEFLCEVIDRWAQVCERVGDPHRASSLIAERARLIETINRVAWDGQWFRRAIDKDGKWLGSKDSAAGQIFLNAQTWAIMGDLADPERLESSWNAVREQLLTEYGPLLLAPAYEVPDPGVGYITRYAPGARENGGVYMHAATWALAAACKRRDIESVTSIWASMSPPRRSEDSERYAAEPYVLPGNVDGPLSGTPGRAGWTWYTGSAAWLQRISLEWVLGIRPEWEGLRIDPCPPAELGAVSVRRRYRGRDLTVKYDAKGFAPGLVAQITIDGRSVPSGVLTEDDLPEIGHSATVLVTWAAKNIIEARPGYDHSGTPGRVPTETTG
jgi:cellobiose phosphorylase